jgi:hypothetical protein
MPTYSQYPKTKLIGQDTVVLLLKSQADDINFKFTQYNEKIAIQQNKIDSQRAIILHRSSNLDSLLNCLDVAIKANATLFQYNVAYREAFAEMFKNIDTAIYKRVRHLPETSYMIFMVIYSLSMLRMTLGLAL